MTKLNKKQEKIIQILLNNNGQIKSSQIYEEYLKTEKIALITIKRILSELTEIGFLEINGSGRSTTYNLTIKGRIFSPTKSEEYIKIDPDKRNGLKNYNFELFTNFPQEIFNEEEEKELNELTNNYNIRTQNLSTTLKNKELERLVIELSWKSSKIEGNTYTLLDTEKLLLENKILPNYTKNETQMILNHKEAFHYIYKNHNQFKTLTNNNLKILHSLLVKNLDINLEFRSKPVGITGSIYQPLDNIYQIEDALEKLNQLINLIASPFDKALITLLGLSYIQPFEDGNKRTARLMTNAILMSHNLSPLSYRSIKEEEYRSALLCFYELNTIIPMKKIFLEQYQFATTNYAVKAN